MGENNGQYTFQLFKKIFLILRNKNILVSYIKVPLPQSVTIALSANKHIFRLALNDLCSGPWFKSFKIARLTGILKTDNIGHFFNTDDTTVICFRNMFLRNNQYFKTTKLVQYTQNKASKVYPTART